MATKRVDAFLDNFSLARREIYIWDDISSELAKEIYKRVTYLIHKSAEPITFLINSNGGELDAQCSIIDSIKRAQSHGITVVTQAFGCAFSAGANILSMGSKGHRYVSPLTSVMIHPLSYGLSEDYAGNQKVATKFINKKADETNRMVADACGMGQGTKYSKFLKDINKGLWLMAAEAVKYGVADKVGDYLANSSDKPGVGTKVGEQGLSEDNVEG